MDIQAKKWPFTPEMIADAPAHSGIYAVWQNDRLLHLGYARSGGTIRSKLLAFAAAASRWGATHYSWEISRSPLQRGREIVLQLEGAK